MENLESFELFERKTEDQAIDDKYQTFVDKIKKMRRKAAKKFGDKSVDIAIRNIQSKIHRYEINIAEKELEILRMRDRKLEMKKQLKKKKFLIDQKKKLKKKKK